jgi:hypothetical protein
MQLTPIIKARNEKKKKKTPLFQCDKRKNHAAMLSHHIQWLEETEKRDLLKELYNI